MKKARKRDSIGDTTRKLTPLTRGTISNAKAQLQEIQRVVIIARTFRKIKMELEARPKIAQTLIVKTDHDSISKEKRQSKSKV